MTSRRPSIPLPAEEMQLLDRWILEKSGDMRRRVLKAYEDYEFHIVFHAVYDFFTVELSSFYLDVIKDRAYCSGRKSALRRSAQTALFRVLKDTLALMAPILPFTADEAWDAMPAFEGKEESVHLGLFPGDGREAGSTRQAVKEMDGLILVREKVLKELEKARESKLIGNSLEAAVVLSVPPGQMELLKKHEAALAELFIVSKVTLGDRNGRRHRNPGGEGGRGQVRALLELVRFRRKERRLSGVLRPVLGRRRRSMGR